ncbi:MAG TPA: hypothetical protein VFV67_24340 [Actinophytocola sp.]|uniref:hypothetical protein n=1 Tax=Actinophytocola sp. TaxID=1872138 RepID=UPI002DB69430|nr:hypothetical protein [Actinophytocola sp.]HEU5473786.1 hypothetical protein [Actinophytocola sp.]
MRAKTQENQIDRPPVPVRARSSTPVRNHARLTVAIVAAIALATVTVTPPSAAAYPAIHTTADVNMRVAPNLSGGIITKLATGSTPRIRCAAPGQLIYDTSVWFYVDLDDGTRGFYSAYYSDADYTTWADLQTRYGIARCDRPASTGGGSMYYQPRYSPGDPFAPYTTYTATKDWWAAGNCAASSADYWPASFDGKIITRAGAWSLGRLGVTYLFAANPTRANQLQTIILFDPGNLADYRSTCDQAYPQDGLMASWLSGNSSRRLLVLAGAVTRDKDHPDSQGRLHQGIQQYLFPAIRAAGRSSQVLVCNYDSMQHPDVLRHFSHLIASGSVTSCPGSPNAAWHP